MPARSGLRFVCIVPLAGSMPAIPESRPGRPRGWPGCRARARRGPVRSILPFGSSLCSLVAVSRSRANLCRPEGGRKTMDHATPRKLDSHAPMVDSPVRCAIPQPGRPGPHRCWSYERISRGSMRRGRRRPRSARIDRSAVQRKACRPARAARQPQDMSETEYDERSFAQPSAGFPAGFSDSAACATHPTVIDRNGAAMSPSELTSEERCAGRVGGRHGARCQSPQAEGRRADRNRSVV